MLSVLERNALDLAAGLTARGSGFPREKLGLLIRSAGGPWADTGREGTHDALSQDEREALDLAAELHSAELDFEMGRLGPEPGARVPAALDPSSTGPAQAPSRKLPAIDRVKRALASGRHVVVHGGTQQGRSQCLAGAIGDDRAVIVQCLPTSSAASLFQEALGQLGVAADLRMSDGGIEGTLDFTVRAEPGTPSAGGHGRAPATLSLIARTIAASGRRLVLEDLHRVDTRTQREIAFLLKAMYEYGVFILVTGGWPRHQPFIYYNGDLAGRIEDIQLT